MYFKQIDKVFNIIERMPLTSKTDLELNAVEVLLQ